MRRPLIIALSLLTFVGQSATWYVRPLVYSSWSGTTPIPTVGTYGNQDGTSYANAWNGLGSVVWGGGGVNSGDTLYVCGTHIMTYKLGVLPHVNNFIITVGSGVTIRGDYPSDPAMVFGGCVDTVSSYVWTGPDANGVYASAVQGSGNSSWALQFQITNNVPYRLKAATNTTWVGGLGECYFVANSSNYVKTIDGSAPGSITLALSGPFGFFLTVTNGTSNTVFQSIHFVDGGLGLTYPDASFYGSTNITFTNCVFTDGACNLGNSYFHVRAGNDNWNILNCEIARTGEGIQADLNSETRGAWGWNVIGNYIHDVNTPEYPTAADPHAIGVQGGSSWNVISNRTYNSGAAIEFWSGAVAQSNNVFAYNHINATYVQTNGTGGGGIVIDNLSGYALEQNVRIYGNILENIGLLPDDPNSDWEGAAIDIGPYAYTEILNNTIYNARIGIQIRVASTNMQAKVENNIISLPTLNFINFLQTGSSTNLTIDYNLFYTNTPLVTPFKNMGSVTHDTHSVFANPKFVSASPSNAVDFKLGIGSPAIDAGTSVGVSTDYEGAAFHNPPSIGAFEDGVNWYVDRAASGANNGTNWANAWTNFNAIVWASVAAGDTIWVSKGNYGLSSSINPTKGGTSGHPITIKLSQEAAHVGDVTNAGFSSSYSWITVDGAKDDTYTNLITSTILVQQITNNIGWHMVTTNSVNADGGGTCINISGTATNGLVFKWLELIQLSDHAEDYGIRYNYSSPMTQSGNEDAYLWIHNCGQDGIKNAAGSSVSGWGATVIHHCIIELNGDDGVELNSGYDVGNCIIRNARDNIMRGHPDGIAGQTFSWSRYYDNIVWGFRRSQCFYPNTLTQSNQNLYIYNNLVYWGDTNTLETSKGVGSVGMEDLYWDPKYGRVPGSSDTNIYWNNVRIFNNTFAALPPYSTTPWAFNNRYKNGWTLNTGEWSTVWMTNVLIYNNSFYMGLNSAFGAANQISCDSTRMTMGWNDGYSTNAAGKSFGTENGSWATGEAMDAAVPGWYGDSSAQPTFASPGPPNWDYRIDPTDTGLKGKGTNLTAYVADNMTGLNVDLWGNTRPTGSTAWDIGANQFTALDTNLIVWLRFTNDLSNGTIVDSSGHTNTFYRYGVSGGSYPSNSITLLTPGTYTGNHPGTGALSWEWFLQPPDPRDAFENGTWAGLPLTNSYKVSLFTNMNQMTYSFWAAADSQRNNYSAMVLDAGNDWYGLWGVGRWFSQTPTNNFSFRVATNFVSGNWVQFNLYYPNSQQLYANQWHFYAGTWSNGIVNIYFDGTNCGTADLSSALTNLSCVWPSSQNEDTTQAYLPWISLGCRTHNGNPLIADWNNTTDYPNNGWFSGGIDDVRIYNTQLSAVDVLAIYNQTQSGGGGNTPFSIGRVTNLRVGKAYVR